MKAIFLTRQGNASSAFETREIDKPSPQKGQALIKVEAFGLNFADVMARRGLYKEAPPLPCVLGYDVAGSIEQLGEGVTGFNIGDRVVAMTRFGGYAQYAVTEALAMAKIPGDIQAAQATALATQYSTAIFAAAEMTVLHAGDKVLIQSGAGGVGSALIQYALHKGCTVYSTAGSQAKIDYLQQSGVQYAINYKTQDFEEEVKRTAGPGALDVVFDAVGGKSVRKGMRLLGAGGRMVCYGAAQLTGQNLLQKISTAIGFGIYHPAFLMMPSKAIIGVNMLKIADEKPHIIQRCLKQVVALTSQGVFKPEISKVFPASDIAAAHTYLEERNSIGKVAVAW